MPLDTGIEVTANSQRYGATLLGNNITSRYTEDFSSPSVAPYFAGLARPAPLRTITLGAWSRFCPQPGNWPFAAVPRGRGMRLAAARTDPGRASRGAVSQRAMWRRESTPIIVATALHAGRVP